MSLEKGHRLGPYEIVSPIGAGGMGEVYQARDTRLDRTVALKVLSSHLSDATSRQRFEREARAISSLSHPHICTLYDIGNQDGVDFLVMEHLEGETLDARLRRGALPVPELMRYAVEVADALEKAHRQGVVHRDLKPANIMITRSGAKLLDFGLARTMEAARPSSDLTASPTMTTPLTAEGKIVGTFQYMAPEQLAGKEADARSDLFAFGAVLYEMATGQRAFSGTTHATLIAAILKEEPRPMAELSAAVPPALQRIVMQCLAKDPDDRWQNAGDLKRELRWIAGSGASVTTTGTPVSMSSSPAAGIARRRRIPAWAAIPPAAALAAALFVLGYAIRPSEPATLLRVSLALPPGAILDNENSGLALSPDGRALAFTASTPDSRFLLWVRALDSGQARSLAGTEGATYPFWSPDGRFLAFFAEGKLKKIPATGGTVQTLCDAPDARGGSWGSKGVIVFSPAPFAGLQQVSASGGTPSPLTELEKPGMTHRLPRFLPDGEHLLFFSGNTQFEKINGVYALDMTRRQVTRVVQENSGGEFAPPGHLAFIRDGNLMTQPFDTRTLATTGEAVPIAENVTHNLNRWSGLYSFSANGLMVFHSGGPGRLSQLTWYDMGGKVQGVLGEPAALGPLTLSPDGRKAAVMIRNPASSDIWIYDLVNGTGSRFTFAANATFFDAPEWSPDGRQIAFANYANGEVLVKAADGASVERVVMKGTVANRAPDAWSPDGSMLAVRAQSGTSYDQWIVPVEGRQEPYAFVASEASDYGGAFSPDGRWFSYISNETGRDELYVIPFPGPGGKWQISREGANNALWVRRGMTILYITDEGRLMLVDLQASGANLQIGQARQVFGGTSLRFPFDITQDGQRMLAVVPVGQSGTQVLDLVVNWAAALAGP